MAQPRRQESLFARNLHMKITVSEGHELVRLSEEIAWDEMIDQVRAIREKKIRLPTGPEPHYRELLGAVALMAVKNLTYRDAEDLIAHYAPARFLCGLDDTDTGGPTTSRSSSSPRCWARMGSVRSIRRS